MKLPGRLRATTLGDVFGELSRDRATGVLELIEAEGMTAGRKHRVRFVAGLVASVESALSVARLGDILRREGFIGDEAQRRLGRSVASRPDKKIGQILVEEAAISPHVIDAALRRQLRARLDALFSLRDSFLRFHVAGRSEHERVIPLSPREFLHGRPRSRDREVRTAATFGRDRARARALSVLGLDGRADRSAVQRAFRSLASAVHPDRHPRASADERASLLKRFAELSAAYHLLVA